MRRAISLAFLLVVLSPLALSAAPGLVPSLRFDGACNLLNDDYTELNVVLEQSPVASYITTSVVLTYTLDGGEQQAASLPFRQRLETTVYYSTDVPGPASLIDILGGTLDVGSTRYTLSNTGTYAVPDCFPPTAIKLSALSTQEEPMEPFTLEYLATVAGATLATWLTVNMIVKAKPDWQAKIVAIPVAFLWTVGAALALAYPVITAGVVGVALANSLLVYTAATGGATMLAARAAEPKRAMAGGKQPFNGKWW